jgi:peptidoglycan/xylan/chitin deacetylase (PgdA/CDA1 family)
MLPFRPIHALALGWLLSSCIAPGPSVSKSPGASAAATEPGTAVPARAFVWPRGTRAAVSLTYDDAIQSQIDNAVPALARHALPATFFLTGSSPYLAEHLDVYRGLVTAGHELGSHTMNHPCDRAQSWVKPGFGLQDYDLDRMRKELDESIQQLKDLGQKAPFSFAYPCGSTWLGEAHVSYVPLIEQSFVAARGVGPGIVDPSAPSLFDVPSPMGNDSGADLTAWVDRALASGGWVVFLFHGVAGDYLDVKAEAHETLLAYLDAHKSSIWTERFGAVASYIKAQAAAPPKDALRDPRRGAE